MALFQKTVEQKYLKQLDSALITAKYQEFKTHFGNTDIQENIRNSKEEQYQGEFLIDLFVKILGYVKNPTPNFNLTTEYKNIKDSKKADGAIIINDSVKAVIELKGTNTTDLSKIEAQAFGYKNNQPGCVYVVTSNFEKLRFYIDNAIEYIEFNLFHLSKADFEILYLCLSFESIEKGIPKKVKEESLSQEDVITRKLYQDYSLFKRELHQNLVTLNPQFDSLTLFKKSQKLLDRFLFLFFAEDRHLLPPNSVRLILTDWRDLQERDVEIPLYQRFKKYFEYLNTGYKGKRYEVFAYNGGLFKPDEVLDTILIDDELLFKHTYNLSEYDFASEIDVNILGHIFENSLNELDEINAQLAGEAIDKTKTKRKKDGVFYTPKYITKYIVENTVGKLCTEKKAELQIVEEEYATDKRRQLKTKQALLDKLKTYQNWLLQLTICDPACGSGAFLNQALDFLITEHRFIDELQAKLLNVPIIFSDIEKSILENNLFGVDLNEESVEIAKLSLWLRTAQPNRKLNDLSNNIKCGNSLISDPAVAGDKAFDWEREFPQVFGRKEMGTPLIEIPKDKTPDYLKLIKEKSLEAQSKAEQALALSKEAAELSKKVYEYAEKLDAFSEDNSVYGFNKGGFDVVIGNPPYVNISTMPEIHNYLKENYPEIHTGYNDLMYYFLNKGLFILNKKGIYGVITSNYFIGNEYAGKLRLFLNKYIEQLVNFEKTLIFEDANVHTVIVFAKKNTEVPVVKFYSYTENIPLVVVNTNNGYSICELNRIDLSDKWLIANFKDQNIINKLHEDSKLLGDICAIEKGSTSGKNSIFTVSYEFAQKHNFEKELLRKNIKNGDIGRYSIIERGYYLIYTDNQTKISNYPNLSKYLGEFKHELESRNEAKKGLYSWYRLERPRDKDLFDSTEKLIVPYRATKNRFAYDNHQFFNDGGDIRIIVVKKNEPYFTKFLLVLLNSNLLDWFYSFIGKLKGDSREYFNKPLSEIPIKNISIPEQQPFIEKADQMLSLNKELQETAQKFQRNIQREFNLEKLSAKLENWIQLSFKEFLKELEKSKIKLTLSQKAEWEDYFLQESQKALDIKQQIDATDKEIDLMVYELYGLTEDEIKIVESSIH